MLDKKPSIRFIIGTFLIVVFLILITSGSLKINSSFSKTNVQLGTKFKVLNPQMALGNPNAKVKIVEYADLMCPFCAKFSQKIMPRINSQYIKTGLVHFEYRPVAVIAQDSARAAEGAYCAGDQNKFWNYYQTVYSTTWNQYYIFGKKPNQIPIFKGNNINTVATNSNLNVQQFDSCLVSGKYQLTVQQSTVSAEKYGMTGTPYFLINNQVYSGYAPFSVYQAIIQSYLPKS